MSGRKLAKRAPYFLVLLALLIGGGTAVFAHNVVITKSVPANGEVLAESPPKVVAWFAEELVSGESTMTVYNREGVQVDNGDGGVDLNDPDHASMVVTLPPLPDGAYTVQWHVVLLDGDATDGAFAFYVGEDVSPIEVSVPEPEEQASVAEPEVEDGGGLPVGIIAAGVAGIVVLLAVGGVIIRRRRA